MASLPINHGGILLFCLKRIADKNKSMIGIKIHQCPSINLSESTKNMSVIKNDKLLQIEKQIKLWSLLIDNKWKSSS